MKAIVHTQYGSADVLRLVEAEKPAPDDGRVLLKVYAASVNPVDYHRMKGGLVRLFGEGLLRPKDPRLGIDVAGRVEAVGRGVTALKPGDEVFGSCAGGFAEYATAREDRLALKPANLSFEQAAAVPVAGITALQGLRDKGHIQSGQKVLVNGASGGVGTFAVQIAKAFGAEVTGVCSTRNLDTARAIGADHVMDYTREDFTRAGQRYDLIYDIVGNRSGSDYRRTLSPGGTCVITGFGFPSPSLSRLFEHMLLRPMLPKSGNQPVTFQGIATITQPDLVFLKGLLEAGKVVPVIDRRFPLAETAEAMRYLGTGHAQGKVVISVEPAPPA